MRAIIIDAKRHLIYEEDISGDLKSLQAVVGGLIEPVDITDADTLFVNEEGLINGTEHFFEYAGAHQPLAGNGVIVARDEDGETVGTKLTVKEVFDKVTFVSSEEIKARYADSRAKSLDIVL